jgi:hypothetical protein
MWGDLYEPYGYDTWSARVDAGLVAAAIQEWVAKVGGCSLCVSERQLAGQLLEYIAHRQTTRAIDLSGPQHNQRIPAGWSQEDEVVWTDWIAHRFTMEDWETHVIAPIFGTDVRSWEAGCEEWRWEVFAFLPTWIQRSAAHLALIDPRPYPDPDPTDGDPRKAAIDPYLLEHGRRGRRIKGARPVE